MPTTRIPYGVLDGRYVNAAGDTMLGELTLAGAPTLDLHAATKKYIDDAVGVGGHTHTLDAGATDVTATATEVNLLDLSGLSIGQVLRATGTASAAWGIIQAGDLPTGIDAAKLADGSVSNVEYQYLNGVTSAIQTQLDAKAADSVVLRKDGSVALTADWNIGDTRKILADGIRARDAAGLELYDDGGNGIFIEDGGEVGIGTVGPDRKLDVLDASNPQLRLTHTDGSVYTDFRTVADGYLYINPSGGRVGIGTGSPSRTLDVAGTIRAGSGATGGFQVTTNAGNTWRIADISGSGILDIDPQSSSDRDIRIRNSLAGSANLIVQDGRLGIGTTSPSQALEVAGNVVIGAHDTYHMLYINRYSSSGYAYIAAGDTDRDVGVGLAFQYRNTNGSPVTGFSMGSDGRIGIGITQASRKLEIIDSSAPQLRLTNVLDTHYIDFETNNIGSMTITPSGSRITIAKELEVDGSFNHDGSTFGVFGVTPASRVAAYTVTNATTDRSFDADNTTIAELADVVATIISDLKTYGFFQ